ncbi:hypothetical protein L596_020549 [Steinernema carpocapsae]|uniref:Major facilitator superfamily (MFS) profile domain-containing protein n=1 Tax=Steinernema carpocapsae TaxID=34508 RepID=A0A4U5MTV6_STECR|nr:hypothetical protein L596_020548 [Steinernema carpocapsae]TKR73212.1 hypothetical protein L596_020549 [Steinernema carpocapsae]
MSKTDIKLQPIPTDRSVSASEESELGLQQEPATDWRSIYIASLLGFSCAVQYSLYFTSLWPYLDVIDKDASETFFSVIIAVYSIGQMLASPLFGYWSNRTKTIRFPMAVGTVLMTLGNLLYFLVELLPSNRRYAILVARFIIGMGSGNFTLLRTYASTACCQADRARAVAFVTGGVAFGTTIGPAIQLVFTPIGYPGFVICKGLSISTYTASAYAACVINILSIAALYTVFNESYAGVLKEQANTDENSVAEIKLPKFDWIAVFVCNFTRFTQQFVNTNLETIGSPFAMQIFGLTNQDTVKYGSLAQGGQGFVALMTYVLFIAGDLNRFIEYRFGNMFALLLFLAFHLVTYAWPFIPDALTTYSNQDLLNATHELVGCNVDKFTWCHSTSRVNIWVYYFSFAIVMGLGFSAVNITLNTIYGRILGPRRQGTMQGVLQVSGGLARLVGPITISALYSAYGPEISWIVEIAVVGVNLLLWVLFYRRMVPLQIPDQ